MKRVNKKVVNNILKEIYSAETHLYSAWKMAEYYQLEKTGVLEKRLRQVGGTFNAIALQFRREKNKKKK